MVAFSPAAGDGELPWHGIGRAAAGKILALGLVFRGGKERRGEPGRQRGDGNGSKERT
jgi:hypothetical protein